MLNTCVTSRISLRTNGPLSFSTNDYSHCSNERHHFACSSSRPCCCCCCCSNPMYRVPLTPNYCYNLYGLRQSSLIQWSPYRRMILGGFDRSYYARLPACDVDGSCYCDKVCNFREKSRVGRKGVLRKCLVFEEKSEMYDLEGFDEAEVVLSLLAEDVDDECFRVTKETKRVVKKPAVDKRENGEVSSKCSSKTRRYDLGVSENERNRRREKILRREEEREEALLREENHKASLREEREQALLTNHTTREKDEREALLSKARRKAAEKQEREGMLRKGNWKVDSRTDDREDLLRREEKLRKEKQERECMLRKENWKVSSRTEDREDLLRREKVRRDGSSCSSYYSFSSTGDIDSDDEIEHRDGRVFGDSSSGQKRNSTNSEIVYHDTRQDDRRRKDYREDYGASLTKKSSSKEGFFVGSSSVVAESDHRKKSEKKLDISVEEMDSRKETSVKESNVSVARESNYEKFADYVSYDDRKVIKSSGSAKIDDEGKQKLIGTGDEVSSQSMKYKQFAEMQDSQRDDVRTSYGSQQVYSGKSEISAKDASSSHETVGLRNRKDEYQRNSQALKIQEIDIKRTSISQQRFETSVKREEDSANIRSSINDALNQQKQYDRVSGQAGSSGKSQQLIREDGKSILKRESDQRMKQEEKKAELSYGSYLESKISKTESSRNESDELTKVLITHSGNSGGVHVEDKNKTKPETSVRPPSNDFAEGSSRLDSTALQGRKKILDKSHTSHHDEAYSRAGSDSKFISHEDAIGSAARLEKSSAHYVAEFVDQVRSEILGSEIQNEHLVQSSSGDDSHSNEPNNDQNSDTKGPSDEMWKVDESSIKDLSKPEIQENTIVKRNGRSLWNIIEDIVRLRWTLPSETHSSGRKTGGRSSPNQSTTSEAWFSGHEEVSEEKEGRSVTQSLSGRHHEEKIGSQFEEGASSLSSDDRQKNVGTNLPSSSVVPERDLSSASVSLPSGGEISEGSLDHTSSIVDPSIPLPELRMRRSPNVSDNGRSEQLGLGVKEGDLKRKILLRKDQLVINRFDEWEEAYRVEAEQRKIDEMFMRQALEEAKKAADNWEVPVGAVLVHNGKIIARGCNLVEELRDSTAHAEMICIREASSTLRTWRLSDTTLYVTLEPCAMCAGAILQARIDTVVWGAPNKLLGADGSWIRLFPSGDGGNGLEQTDKPPAPVHPFHTKIIIRRGVLASECADAMQQFFKLRRKKDKKPDPSPSPPSCLPISHRPSKFLAKMHDTFTLMFCL